ncbi:DUF5662 family protein [Lachnospiraceae bacterium OttesenSCG-928-D06]|nr:DUF5662 family protein [Lachnospiraceae bacterium OttesenSCG-928-D06]
MINIIKAWKHFKTISYHKILVAKGCFRIGLYYQGIMHDLSKYSKTEFLIGMKYYQGNRSPNNKEREVTGYSSAWLHHKGRNKHHYEYWVDYNSRNDTVPMKPVPMPDKYIAEMIIDRIAASKVYEGKNYIDSSALSYYEQGKDFTIMHPYTQKRLEFFLKMLAEKGEEKTFLYIKEKFLKKNRKKVLHK